MQTKAKTPPPRPRRYVTEIAADEVQFLSTKSEDGRDDGSDFDGLTSIDEDLPF